MTKTHLIDGMPSGTASAAAGHPGHRPTWAEIDLRAIRHNVRALRAHAGGRPLLAAVKADGYGHGLVESAHAAVAGGATWLGVATVEEGLVLRGAAITARILVFTEPPADAIPAMLDGQLTPGVYSPAFARHLDAAAQQRGGGPAAVHCKLDTGMRRVGVPETQWEEMLRFVRDAQGLRLEGLWSHLAIADEPDHPFTGRQLEAFERGLALATSLGIEPDLVHLANSAGVLFHPDTHFDLVRAGIAVYGLSPSVTAPTPLDLRPALSWRTRVGLVKQLAPGEAVSYGLRFSAEASTVIASLPAGYADGVRRNLSNVGQMVAAGQRVPIAGNVCMDQTLLDVGSLPVAVGDEVCLIGCQGDAQVTADDWAAWLGTINYEITCGIGSRVPRVYVEGGRGA